MGNRRVRPEEDHIGVGHARKHSQNKSALCRGIFIHVTSIYLIWLYVVYRLVLLFYLQLNNGSGVNFFCSIYCTLGGCTFTWKLCHSKCIILNSGCSMSDIDIVS